MQIINSSNNRKLWSFEGEIGAGKTTLIKAICLEFGVTDEVSSPTFSLVNEYHTHDNKIIYHFDFFRINSIEEVYDIGYEEYFYSGHFCFIEWSEKILNLLPQEIVRVTIKVENENRLITFQS